MLAGVGKASRNAKKPIAATVSTEPLNLGKVQWQVVGQYPMLDLGLRPGDSFVGLRHLLDIIDPCLERIVIDLRRGM